MITGDELFFAETGMCAFLCVVIAVVLYMKNRYDPFPYLLGSAVFGLIGWALATFLCFVFYLCCPNNFIMEDEQVASHYDSKYQNHFFLKDESASITAVNPDNNNLLTEDKIDLNTNSLFGTHVLKQDRDKVLVDIDLLYSWMAHISIKLQ